MWLLSIQAPNVAAKKAIDLRRQSIAIIGLILALFMPSLDTTASLIVNVFHVQARRPSASPTMHTPAPQVADKVRLVDKVPYLTVSDPWARLLPSLAHQLISS